MPGFSGALDDIDAADEDVTKALELASGTDNAGRNRAMTLCSVAAIAAEREQWARALEHAQSAVDECAIHCPESLAVALLNLAQAQARSGDYDSAAATADRAEPLVGDIGAEASLAHLRGFIAMGRDDVERAAELFADYARHTSAHPGLLEPHHRSESAKAVAFGQHAAVDLRGAQDSYLAVVESARGEDSPMTLVAALVQASGATQDRALAEGETESASELHTYANELICEAADLARAARRYEMAAVCDLTAVRYITQFHSASAAADVSALRAALSKVLAAAVYLHHVSFASSRHAQRRHFAQQRSAEAFALAFSLAYRLGASNVVAQLIELRCAATAFDVGRGRPTGAAEVSRDTPDLFADGVAELLAGSTPAVTDDVGVNAAAPPPLRLSIDGELVLAEAFTNAADRYLLTDRRTPVDTW